MLHRRTWRKRWPIEIQALKKKSLMFGLLSITKIKTKNKKRKKGKKNKKKTADLETFRCGYEGCPQCANWRPRVSSETSGLRHGEQLRCVTVIFLIQGNTHNYPRGVSVWGAHEQTSLAIRVPGQLVKQPTPPKSLQVNAQYYGYCV